MKDGVASSESRERRKRRKMPVHGRGLEAILNAEANRLRADRVKFAAHNAKLPRQAPRSEG